MSANIDRIFEELGGLGPQQLRYCLCLCLFNAYGSWHMLQYSFVIGDTPNFTCRTSGADPLAPSTCPARDDGGMEEECSIDDDASSSSSIVSSFGLVCGRAWLAPFSMSLFMAGVMVGAPLTGSLSDRRGRRSTITSCLSAMVVATALSATAADSYWSYALLRFVAGFFCGGFLLTSFVLSSELVGASHRGHMGNAMQASFAVGIMLLSLTAYYIQHSWRHLTATTAIVGVPLALLAGLYLPESPRWLQSKGRIAESLHVLDRLTGGHGGRQKRLSVSAGEEAVELAAKSSSSLELFRRWTLARITLIQVFSWFVNGATYYGLTLSASSDTDGSRYASTALSGAVEIPAYLLATLFLSYRGRRWTLCVFMISGGFSLLLLLLLPQSLEDGLVQPMALLCKLAIAASFSIVYIHSSEIFPTSIRNSAMGIVSVAARAGGIAAPFLAQLGQVGRGDHLHLLVFGAMTLSAGILNLQLPETKGVPLPETVPDLLLNLAAAAARQRGDGRSYRKIVASGSDAEDI